MEIEDLVVLQYTPNNCYTQVVMANHCQDLHNGKLQIGILDGNWSYDKCWKNIPIGKARSLGRMGAEYRAGVIGVYDRNKTDDLNRMVWDAREFTESHDVLED